MSAQSSSGGLPLTVVIVAYDSADVLSGCLESVVGQEGVSLSVIVVDNGASEFGEETATICERYPDVEYVPSDRNEGFPTAVNRGFDRAETEYLCTVNPDARVDDGFFATLLEPIEAGRADVTTPKILHVDDPDRIQTCGLQNHFTGISFRQASDLPADHPDWSREREIGGLSGCAFATTADTWEAVGGFDEELFMYKDDVSLSWACLFCDRRIRLVTDAIAWHDVGDDDPDGWKLGQIERGRMLLLLKYYPASALALLPSLLLAELLVWGLALSVGASGVRHKLRTYAVPFGAEGRALRAESRDFQRRFPDRLEALDTGLPWDELRRRGVVPDTRLVEAVGRLADALFALNVSLYRALVRR